MALKSNVPPQSSSNSADISKSTNYKNDSSNSTSSIVSETSSVNKREKKNKDIEWPLHYAVFINDSNAFLEILKDLKSKDPNDAIDEINRKDKHGNTALHLAAMMGRHEFVEQLLAHGAQVTVKNLQRWSPLAEACSYGNRDTIRLMALKIRSELKKGLEKRTKGLDTALESIADFRLKLRWEFTSWIPLLSRILPSDVCEITKKGASIRVDTTLVDFTERSWERGDISFLYCKQENPWTILDNKAKVYQKIRYEHVDYDVEDQIDSLMSSDIVDAHLDTKNINFTRATKGWLWKEDLSGSVGPWHADFYHVDGLNFIARKRREHLSEQDLKDNKKALACLTSGATSKSTNNTTNLNGENIKDESKDKSQGIDMQEGNEIEGEKAVDEEEEEEEERRKSLPPPPRRNVSWKDYIDSPEGKHPILGREPVTKENSKSFKAKIALSQEFPLMKSALLDILLAVAPLKLFKKLRDFVELKLPDGFPVKVDIPIIPTVIASVTFENFSFDDGTINPDLFKIPDDYEENSERFPEL